MFAFASRLKYLYLAYLSAPSSDRLLYRSIRRRQVRSIVEIGIGQARRSLRMIEVAQSLAAARPVRFTAIDPFELRAAGANGGLTLKQAYRRLKATGARVQVVPGDPYAALSRVANTLAKTDLLVISADVDEDSLSRAWFYVPRMLYKHSLVLLEDRNDAGVCQLRAVDSKEIAALAAVHVGHRRAA